MPPFSYPPTHPSTHLFIHSATHPTIHPFSYPPTHPSTHLFIQLPTHLPTHPPTYSSIQLPTYTPTRTPIHSAANPPTHPPTYSSIQLPTHPRVQLATHPHAYPPTYTHPLTTTAPFFCLCVSEESCCGKKCFVVTVVGLFLFVTFVSLPAGTCSSLIGWRARSAARAAQRLQSPGPPRSQTVHLTALVAGPRCLWNAQRLESECSISMRAIGLHLIESGNKGVKLALERRH